MLGNQRLSHRLLRQVVTRRRSWPCLALFVAVHSLTGCAIHLRIPRADPGAARAVTPAVVESHIAVVARLSHAQLGAIFDRVAIAPIEAGQDSPIASWKVRVQRAGKATVSGARGRVCLRQPLRSAGHVKVLNRRLEHQVAAHLMVCGLPVVTEDGMLRLGDAQATVHVDRQTVARRTAIVYEQIEAIIAQQISPALSAAVADAAVPLASALAPLRQALALPVALPGGACLKLRPDQIRLGRPEVDPGHVRLTASVRARPTVELPCALGSAPLQPLALKITPGLRHPLATLRLPVAVAVTDQREAVRKLLRGAGRIETRSGWFEVHDVSLGTGDGHLVATLQVRGESRSRWLGMGWRRQIDGEVALWGRPAVGPTHLGVQDMQVTLDSGDLLADLSAAMQRQGLNKAMAAKLRWPKADLNARARTMLARIARPLQVGGDQIPIRIDTRKFGVVGARAAGGQLIFDFDFEGHVVVGDVKRR